MAQNPIYIHRIVKSRSQWTLTVHGAREWSHGVWGPLWFFTFKLGTSYVSCKIERKPIAICTESPF
eukprot:464044-Amphidinium_carterae.1